jgi:hypothetical protein
MVGGMEFGFLFDPARQLLSIGYQVAEYFDPGCYVCWPRSAWRASSRLPRATSRPPLVPFGRPNSGRRGAADLVVGIDVQY